MKKAVYIAGLLFLTLVSCDNKPTLQKYFVQHSEQRNFATLDIAPTFIKTGDSKMSAEEQKALASLHKLNVLIYKPDSLDHSGYDIERQHVKDILKDNKKYEQLMKFGSGSKGASIYSVGKDVNIDEFVVFAYQKENGFSVIRVLGDDMNPTNIMTLVKIIGKNGLNMDQLQPLKEFAK